MFSTTYGELMARRFFVCHAGVTWNPNHLPLQALNAGSPSCRKSRLSHAQRLWLTLQTTT